MSKKVFVGNLSWNTVEDDLLQLFGQFGEVLEAKIITDRETGRSRGFAFITFAEDQDANSAISSMDGTELDGRSLRVNEAQERSRGPGGGGGGRGGGGGGYRGGGDRGRGGGGGRW